MLNLLWWGKCLKNYILRNISTWGSLIIEMMSVVITSVSGVSECGYLEYELGIWSSWMWIWLLWVWVWFSVSTVIMSVCGYNECDWVRMVSEQELEFSYCVCGYYISMSVNMVVSVRMHMVIMSGSMFIACACGCVIVSVAIMTLIVTGVHVSMVQYHCLVPVSTSSQGRNCQRIWSRPFCHPCWSS